MQIVIQKTAEVYQSAYRTAKVLYHTAAFASLAILITLVSTHHVNGTASANLAYGQDEMVSLLQAANTPLPTKHADATPMPGRKPVAPATVR